MRSLNAGTIAQPYITSVDGVARADPRRLLSERYRGLANTPRRVEDPVVVKSRVAKVCYAQLLLPMNFPMMILYPISLDAETLVPSWVPLCILESSLT